MCFSFCTTLLWHIKGSVLLECLRCVDTLVLVLKHAEACPYVVMRFAPSLIVAGMIHRISSRLTQIQRDSTRRIFVGICGDLWFGFKTTNFTNHTNIFLLNPCDYSCWILLNLCEGFLFVEGEWRVIFCVNGVGDFDVPWFFCIFVIIKLSQAWMRLY